MVHPGEGMVTRVALSGSRHRGRVAFRPKQSAVPVAFHVPKGTDVAEIFVGPDGAHPPSNNLVITLRDRHAKAWADINDDGRIDALIVGGALSGSLAHASFPVWDELFLYTDQVMRNYGQSLLRMESRALRGC